MGGDELAGGVHGELAYPQVDGWDPMKGGLDGADGSAGEDVIAAHQHGVGDLSGLVEEELGLSLHNVEHPLKQGLGAGFGALLASIFILTSSLFSPFFGFLTALLVIALSAALLAHFARNRLIPAIIWNLALALLAFGITYYTLQIFK